MSYILKNKNDYITLTNYFLNESIVPIKTSYGTNNERNDGNFYEFDNYIVTFFEQNNLYYVVGLDKRTGDIGFGASDDNTLNPEDYSDSKFINRSPINLFGKVYYIILKILQNTKIKRIQFDSANFALGKIYDKLVKNKYFLKSLEDNGYKFTGKNDDKYVFHKI